MRVVVNPGGDDEEVIASNVDVADSFVAQTVGLMGKSSIPDDYALVFEFDGAARRFIHMLFVRMPLDVVWVTDGEVVQVERLSPWTGIGMARSDCIIELPAGAGTDVGIGDTIAVVETDADATADTDVVDAADSDDENPVAEAIDEAVEQAGGIDEEAATPRSATDESLADDEQE